MGLILDPTAGITFPNSTTQASAGQVLQVVSVPYTGVTSTSSTSYVTTGSSASITPKFSTSKILIIVNGTTYASSSGTFGYYTIFRGTVSGTNLAGTQFAIVGNSSSDAQGIASMSYLDSPATTSTTTYTVGMLKSGSGTITWNATSSVSNIVLMEIAV